MVGYTQIASKSAQHIGLDCADILLAKDKISGLDIQQPAENTYRK